jgi:hypothetical protein
MAPLSNELRSMLERAIIRAREIAEEEAQAAFIRLAVNRNEPFASLHAEQRRLRNALRAKARQLGGGSSSQDKGFKLLVEEVAYEQWHRRLFARFLVENNLLMHPSGVAVTLEECDELVAEEGEADGWQLAARYASLMLPGIFRDDDPAWCHSLQKGGISLNGSLPIFPLYSSSPTIPLAGSISFGKRRENKK